MSKNPDLSRKLEGSPSNVRPDYVLVTWLDTILTLDDDSDMLRHVVASMALRPIRVFIGDGKITLATVSTKSGLLNALLTNDFELEGSLIDGFGVRIEGFWLCADANSEVTCSRQHRGGWETFRLLAFNDIKSITDDVSEKVLAFPKVHRKRKIPRVLHSVYLTSARVGRRLPSIVSYNLASIRAANPEYQHRLWTNQEVFDAIYDWYGFEVLQQFLSINPCYGAARADLFRYLLIYKEGGVYLDIKSGLARPLRQIFGDEDSYLISQWSNPKTGAHPELSHIAGGEYQQWFIVSEPGHPFLSTVIERVLRNILSYSAERFGVAQMGVLRVTGPIAYTLAIAPILQSHDHRVFNADLSGFIFQQIPGLSSVTGRHYSRLQEDVVV